MVCIGHRGQGVEGQEHLVSLILGHVEDQNRNYGITDNVLPQVSVNELEPFGGFAGKQGVGKAYFRQDTLQGFSLSLGVLPPVMGIR